MKPPSQGRLGPLNALMIASRSLAVAALALVLLLPCARFLGAAPAAPAAAAATATAVSAPLEPTRFGPAIAQVTARLLETKHYDRHPIDAATSERMLKNYLDSLDYNHMIFIEPDVRRFKARFGRTLGRRLKDGDLSPAYEIFKVFLGRLRDLDAWVRRYAHTQTNFTVPESIILDRHDIPRPASVAAAEDLWRRRVKYDLIAERLNKTKLEAAASDVEKRYDRLLKGYEEFESSDVLEEYLLALTHSYDPHSDYMGPPRRETFNIEMGLSLFGIGAVLSSEDGYAKIVRLVPGGPAEKSHRLKPNDKIEAVAQGNEPFVSVVGMRLDHVVELIRGPKGTLVRLKVIPALAADPTHRRIVTIVRDKINLLDREAKARIVRIGLASGEKAAVGIISLPSFYLDMQTAFRPKSSARDVMKLLRYIESKGVDGVVLDVRNNGGGSLSESISMAGLFVPKGPAVQVRDEEGDVRVLGTPETAPLYQGPLVVLTNRASASASEILAAALQDYDRAVIVGDKDTFGKGTVQAVLELSRYLTGEAGRKAGALKLTIQKFYRITGHSTQLKGVIPDIQLPSVEDLMDFTEASLPYALPFDQIAPLPFHPAGDVAAELPDLRRKSEKRIAASNGFALVRQEMRRYRKTKEEKRVSLVWAKRLQEKKEEEAWQKHRDAVLARHQSPFLESKEVTLEEISGATAPPAVSSAAASVAVSTGAAETPDLDLEEGVEIVGDMIVSGRAVAGAKP